MNPFLIFILSMAYAYIGVTVGFNLNDKMKGLQDKSHTCVAIGILWPLIIVLGAGVLIYYVLSLPRLVWKEWRSQ
jgi:uncharacterized membrane protein AbrB (regulator of aidB expression)